MIYFTFYETPIQTLRLVGDGRSLTGLYMMSEKHHLIPPRDWLEDESVAPFPETKQQLTAYFAGTLTKFDLPLKLQGTIFQQQVWEALKTIPYNTTMSYGELAKVFWATQSISCSWFSQWTKSSVDRCALSPCDCSQWQVNGIWWWY